MAIFLFFSLAITIIIVGFLFNYYLSPVNHDIIEKEILITDGEDIDSVIATLYKMELIRNPKVFKMYLTIYSIDKMKEGSFKLKSSMGSKEIAHLLSDTQ